MYVGKPKEICHLEDRAVDEKTIDCLIDLRLGSRPYVPNAPRP